jgi:hypothetical protein
LLSGAGVVAILAGFTVVGERLARRFAGGQRGQRPRTSPPTPDQKRESSKRPG